MANIVWPPSLPQRVLRNGFSEKRKPNIISTDLEVGPEQTRPRGTFQGVTFSCSLRLTLEQKIVFDNFYQYTTISGTQKFEFPDFYIDNTVIEVKFNAKTPPEASSVGGKYFDYSFALDLQPSSV